MKTAMLTRRRLLQSVAAGATCSALPHSVLANPSAKATPGKAKSAKRVIFYMQQHGFNEMFALPKGEKRSGDSLRDLTLPAELAPLQPYLDKTNIINGLHGLHIKPGHSAFFGALGGFHKTRQNPPGATIDAVISRYLPETLLPYICVGMDNLTRMTNRAVTHALTSAGPNKPEPMICNPVLLYKTLFGAVSKDTRAEFSETVSSLELIEREAGIDLAKLPSNEQKRRAPFVHGCKHLTQIRAKLAGMGDYLADYAPDYDERFTAPKSHVEWHDALLDVSMGALKAGLTNVLNIAPGCGDVSGGTYTQVGLGGGHGVGHRAKEKVFGPIHQYNMEVLVRIIKDLENTPEENGNMMDNTLIIYMSECSNHQHSPGDNWPLVTIGNLGGKLNTGNYVSYSKPRRPLNAFYNTLLHAVGHQQDHFNLDATQILKWEGKKNGGPLESLLA
jgi:hypothetical protein